MNRKYFIQKKLITLIALFCIACLVSYGCGIRKEKQGRVLAKINNYIFTVDDFKDELQHSPYAGYAKLDKRRFLESKIREEILVQEAQRQGLDRNKTFMKAIERYWKQTLIKELLQKETKAIQGEVTSENKRKETIDAWVEALYKKAKFKIYDDALKELEEGRE